ncbi:hypothetical protein QEN19_001616 [Hanseniaspora menglaensis]
MSYNMKHYLNKNVLIVLSEGEIYEGKLIGFDKHLNLTLEKFTIKKEKSEENKHIMSVVRGDLIVFLGEIDSDKIYELDEKNKDNETYKSMVNNINRDSFKFYKSTKNIPNEREIKTWKKVYELRQENSKKRPLAEPESSSDHKKVKV